MKKLFILFLTLASIAVIVLGNLHWRNLNPVPATTAAESTEPTVEPEEKETVSPEDSSGDYMNLTSNWSPDLQEIYSEKLENGEPFTLVLAGSQAMDSTEPGWNDLVTESVKDKFGDSIIVNSISYESNSFDFVSEDQAEEIASLSPDLVIFEPLTLNDNSIVRIEDSLIHIETIFADISASNTEVEFILTPPQPVYSPAWYATQISELQKFADQEGYTYIDHWENWPDVESEEIKSYLDEDSSPNAQGQKAWADAITSYLIAE